MYSIINHGQNFCKEARGSGQGAGEVARELSGAKFFDWETNDDKKQERYNSIFTYNQSDNGYNLFGRQIMKIMLF